MLVPKKQLHGSSVCNCHNKQGSAKCAGPTIVWQTASRMMDTSFRRFLSSQIRLSLHFCADVGWKYSTFHMIETSSCFYMKFFSTITLSCSSLWMIVGFIKSLASLMRVPSLLKWYASTTVRIHVCNSTGVLQDKNLKSKHLNIRIHETWITRQEPETNSWCYYRLSGDDMRFYYIYICLNEDENWLGP